MPFSQVGRSTGGHGYITHGRCRLIRFLHLIIGLIMQPFILLIRGPIFHQTLHRTILQTHQPEHRSTNIIVLLIQNTPFPMFRPKMSIQHHIQLGYIREDHSSTESPPPKGGRMLRPNGLLYTGKVLKFHWNFQDQLWFFPEGC